jgi:hypothetical protein
MRLVKIAEPVKLMARLFGPNIRPIEIGYNEGTEALPTGAAAHQFT